MSNRKKKSPGPLTWRLRFGPLVFFLLMPSLAAFGQEHEFEEAVALLEQGEARLDIRALNRAEAIFLENCQGPGRDSFCEYYLGRVALAQYSYFSSVKPHPGKASRALSRAEKFGRQALVRRPNDPEVHVLMGKIYQVKLSQRPVSELSQAVLDQSPVVKSFTRALELDPDNGEAELGLGIYYLFIPQFLGGDGHRARNHFKRAAKLMPDNPEPLVWLSIAYRQEGRLREARQYLDRAIALDPNHPFVQAEAARLLSAERGQRK